MAAECEDQAAWVPPLRRTPTTPSAQCNSAPDRLPGRAVLPSTRTRTSWPARPAPTGPSSQSAPPPVRMQPTPSSTCSATTRAGPDRPLAAGPFLHDGGVRSGRRNAWGGGGASSVRDVRYESGPFRPRWRCSPPHPPPHRPLPSKPSVVSWLRGRAAWPAVAIQSKHAMFGPAQPPGGARAQQGHHQRRRRDVGQHRRGDQAPPGAKPRGDHPRPRGCVPNHLPQVSDGNGGVVGQGRASAPWGGRPCPAPPFRRRTAP